MWIMTTYGFFSVTQSQDDHNVLMVRARRREHIEKLQSAFKVLKGLEVVDWPNRDYRLSPKKHFNGRKTCFVRYLCIERRLEQFSLQFAHRVNILRNPGYGIHCWPSPIH